jgi:hypothetical protein
VSNDRPSHNFIIQVDIESTAISHGQEELGNIVGIKGTRLGGEPRWEILICQLVDFLHATQDSPYNR